MKKLFLSLFTTLSFALAASAQDSTNNAEGLVLWSQIHEVFSHPRCSNCHVGGDGIPMWSGPSYGPEPMAHGMFIAGGEDRHGGDTLDCSTCHTSRNGLIAHSPPGAPHWGLPPTSMQWFGLTSAQICAQIKDPARNGNRSLADVRHHIENDALVLWGWDPGPGRQPAPYSASQVAGFIESWEALGTPCPADNDSGGEG